jgi:RNA polymerase sigma-70 factor (ECF subfamily)
MTGGEEVGKEPPVSAAVNVLASGEAKALMALAQAVSDRQESLPWLLEAARDGNADAFAALVRRFQASTYQFILRMVRRGAVAEDLSQEVFVRMWRNLGHIESAGMLPGWLRRVAANAVIDHWRKEESRQRRIQELREHPIARRIVRPSTRMESREALGSVQEAIETLPAKLKSVLVLRTREGLSYEELADVLGLSLNAVRSRLFRARQELLEALKHSSAADYLAQMYGPGDGGQGK